MCIEVSTTCMYDVYNVMYIWGPLCPRSASRCLRRVYDVCDVSDDVSDVYNV